MVRLLVVFGLLFVLLVVAVLVFYQANRQFADAWTQCVTESDMAAHLRSPGSAADITLFFAETVDCVDERKGPLAALFFDRQDALEKIEKQFRTVAAEQAKTEREMREVEAEINAQQSDWEAEQNLQQFRQGVYQGGSGK